MLRFAQNTAKLAPEQFPAPLESSATLSAGQAVAENGWMDGWFLFRRSLGSFIFFYLRLSELYISREEQSNIPPLTGLTLCLVHGAKIKNT